MPRTRITSPCGIRIGTCESHTTLTEYELGPQGFGTPDGGFMTTFADCRCIVFVEAKRGLFADSYRPPDLKKTEELSDPSLHMGKLCNDNKFNSSINGQLELRWRFVNALRASSTKNALIVPEQHVPVLPPDLMAGDRFYWRLFLKPDKKIEANWRRVDMTSDLRCLHDSLKIVDDFYLLSVMTCPPIIGP